MRELVRQKLLVIRKIDAELAARVGKEKVVIARQVLAELLGMGREEEEEHEQAG